MGGFSAIHGTTVVMKPNWAEQLALQPRTLWNQLFGLYELPTGSYRRLKSMLAGSSPWTLDWAWLLADHHGVRIKEMFEIVPNTDRRPW